VKRKILMAGNWKMHKTVAEATRLVDGLKESLADVKDRQILVCPPFTALHAVGQMLGGSNIQLGAQNLYPATEGAFTGEVSAKMLLDVGCQYVVLGHSERRQYFWESNEFISHKLEAALGEGIKPILCVGETLAERQSGREKIVVSTHVHGCLQGIGTNTMREVTIAYEPVWAIGTGQTATPQEANDMHRAIREVLDGLYGGDVAQGTCIMYGGSVKPDNVDELMSQPDIDGALVGGASLKVDSFTRIVKFQS
jgi:triosephosphate isomerase